LVSPDGVVPSRMGGVSASVNLPLHHEVQKFSSGTSSPGWCWKKRHKTVVVWCGLRGETCNIKIGILVHATMHQVTKYAQSLTSGVLKN